MVRVIRVGLPSETAIAGCDLAPYVLLRRPDGTVTDEEVEDAVVVDGCYVKSTWYRSASERGRAVCSVHPGERATVQCILCIKAGVLPHKTYHCSPKCFVASWPQHMAMHSHPHSGQNGHPGEAGKHGDGGGANASPYRSSGGGSSQFGARASVNNPYMNSQPGRSAPGVSAAQAERDNVDYWSEVSRSRHYTPTADDIGYLLKYECAVVDAATNTVVEPANTVYTSRVIQAPQPLIRQMVPVFEHRPGDGMSDVTFSVLSFNVLANLYASPELYSYCQPWALGWSYRRQNLLREILNSNADILCLQEVQSDHFEDFFGPELDKAGYTAVYKKKTGEVYTGTAYAFDGCATFFRRDRFVLVKKYEVEFNKAALSLIDAITHPPSKKAAHNRLLKDNVALILVLEAIDPPDPEAAAAGKRQLICVANTHIHANPELKDVKLWQVHTLLKGLEKIAASADIPMIVAGDFNSVPGSAPHSLLSMGRVDPGHPDLQVDPLGILPPSAKICHSLPLISAYSVLINRNICNVPVPEHQRRKIDPASCEPLFTNYTRDFSGTLDYVFYTANSLQPVALQELLDEEVLARDTALPCPAISSDHVSLVAEFRYKLHR
eukprot:jgi/Mesvir1/20630/Mv14856-RA.1